MNEYIFRFPANMPELSYEALRAGLDATWTALRIGSTVQVWEDARGGVAVQLYDTVIARVCADRVEFTEADDGRMATSEWLAQILRDNGIAGGCGRVRRRKADGPGPWVSRGRAGLLVLCEYDGPRDARREVIGKSYPVNPERQAARRAYLARWAEFKAGHLTWDQAFASHAGA
jgi:hypothetical protein